MTHVHEEEEIETSGREGRDDAKERMARLPTHFNLDEIRKRIQSEKDWQESGRNQFALFHSGALRIGFFGFQEGTGIEDHKVNGHVAVHVLQGRVEVSGGGRPTTVINANEFVGLDGMKTFTLKAQAESYAIIAFEQGEGVAEPARGNDQGKQISR
jgi:hypothetical protein